MNQKSRQEVKTNIEKDFYKVMNNSNFGYDCRNNLDNCKFVAIFDEIKEVTYLSRYFNYFDQRISDFVTTDLIKQNIEERYNDKLIKLDKDERFYKIKLNSLNTDRLSDIEAAENVKKNRKKNIKRTIWLIFLLEKTKL